MKTAHMVLIGAGVLGVGYVLLRPRSANAMPGDFLPGVQIQETAADASARAAAAVRSAVGAKASTGWASGIKSVIAQVNAANNAGAAKAAGQYANKLLPGSGDIAEAGFRTFANTMTTGQVKAGAAVVDKIKSWF